MLKFVVSFLGHDAKVYSSQKEDSTTTLKIFAREAVANDVLVCHKMNYLYAVYLCHSAKETIAYRLQLIGPKLEKVTQIVVYHCNTSSWNTMHIAFELLHVQKGEASVCHSTPIDILVWGFGLV
ncbi:hypothetical protein SLEP1_g7124 [Rubroshorea leprosula]|uniref:BURP domain-containing protein n=1 Tax=Rubroshorea leprosula TaxID=152421 RepID=A0AAV5I874_9ROSI|nr:hypothetical protein SLEP1_g7124 [Rubroshorea leprosula]